MSARVIPTAVETWPSIQVDVVEEADSALPGWTACVIGENVKFSTQGLASYFFAEWKPIVFDLLVLAGAVEYCDKVRKRSTIHWGRCISCRIPVHDPALWNTPHALESLREALKLLTGDRWKIEFKSRQEPVPAVPRTQLSLQYQVDAVIPYSNGLDSRAVAGIVSQQLGQRLVRVRLGTSKHSDPDAKRAVFASVPYAVHPNQNNLESTGRARGFKFTLIAAVAAYLSDCHRVIMPESFQGSIGVAFVPVGQPHEDYRNHPRFTVLMSAFIRAVLNYDVAYEYPRLLFTKAETIKEYLAAEPDAPWANTRSCWQQSRQASVDGKRRQCGICAACLLRRMSVHAAGLSEADETYVWENLSAPSLEAGAARNLPEHHFTTAMKHYAIAGALHLDHLAELSNAPLDDETVSNGVFHLAKALDQPEDDIRVGVHRALDQHATEWKSFKDSLGSDSFVIRQLEAA